MENHKFHTQKYELKISFKLLDQNTMQFKVVNEDEKNQLFDFGKILTNNIF